MAATPVQAPISTPAPPAASPPLLLAPGAAAEGQGVIVFRWQATGPLPPGAGYEVVWWNQDEPPQSARGLAAPTQALALEANVDVLFASPQVRDGRFLWTVLVVSENPYVRLTQPEASPQHLLIRPR